MEMRKPRRFLPLVYFLLCSSFSLITTPALAQTCTPNSNTLCLQGGRFLVTLTYQYNGTQTGNAVPRTNESGFFWFFNNQNGEVLVKVLDGTSINGNFWVFHSAMTHLAYNMTVTDTVTGISKTFNKAANSFCGSADTTTFSASGSVAKQQITQEEQAVLLAEFYDFENSLNLAEKTETHAHVAAKAGSCTASTTALCLQNARFEVTVSYVDPNTGQTKAAKTHTYGDQTGFFYFFSPGNLEIGVKVLDGLTNNGYYWVYLSGATDVPYTVTVKDKVLGTQKSYPSAGALCGQGDSAAFGNPKLRLQQGATVISRNGNINLGNTTYNQTLTKIFTIYNDGTAPLAVSNLDWDGTEISLVTAPPTSIPQNGNGSFTLAFSGATSGSLTREIRLTTSDLGINPFRFNASWTVANPVGPIIRLKRGSTVISQGQTVDFGNTGVGQTLSVTFTAENIGDQPLTIAPIALTSNASDPSHFNVVSNNVSNIQPGLSGTFTLGFDAAGLGSVTRAVDLFVGGTSKLRFFTKATVLPGDFTVSLGPASRTVNPGQNAFYTVTINPLYGFSGTVALAISGIPGDVTPRFTPVNVPAGSTSELRLATGSNTQPGTFPFTVTGTQGGTTRTAQASLTVADPSDFSIAATPAQRTVTQGQSTTYAVTANAINGFNSSVALSLTGLPTNTTASFSPTSIMPGQNSTLTVHTTANTPEGNHTLTIRGSNGGRTRTQTVTLTVNEANVGEPLITSINPDHVNGGQQTQMVLNGQNLQGASVAIATEPAEPGDPVPTAFPGISVVSIAPNGTSMTVNIDARNSQVSGFYTMIVTTSGGETGAVFRVVTNGPQVDAWSPSEPVRGQVYQLLIMGYNMRNATVSSANSGIETFVLGSTDTQINGFMIVNNNAPLGSTFLTVRNNGISVQLPINVVATASTLLNEHNLFAEYSERAAAAGIVAPDVYLQDLAFDPSLAAANNTASSTSNKGLCFVTLGWSIYRYNYTVLLPFDPLTGKIDRNVLQGLGLGQTIPAGVKVFSAFVDLYLEVQFRCFPVSHIQVCIYGNVGAEIPGVGGLILSAGGCFFGGAFFPWINTSGYLANFNFGTSNSCSSASPITLPGEGGNQRANVTLNDCCPSHLLTTVEGRSFPEVPGYSWEFTGANIPVAEVTPGGSCSSCSCDGPGIPAHGSSPLVKNGSQVPPPNITGPGKVRFFGSQVALANYRVIPEGLPPNPTTANLITPTTGMVYESDGFLVRMDEDCGYRWFKVGNGCSVSIQANATDPVQFTGYYDCSIPGSIAGKPEWRDGNLCPIDDNFHMALTVNPFPNPDCRPSMPTCGNARITLNSLNQFENPSFESGSTAPFTQGVNLGTLTVETDPAHTRGGQTSLKHQANGDPGSWSPTAPWNGNNQIDVTLEKEDTYRFTAWVKAAAPDTRVRLFIFAKDASGQTSAPYYLGQSFAVGTEWTQLSLTHTVQPGYKYVTVRVDVKEPGTVWWDDFRIDPVDNLIDNPGFEANTKSISAESKGPLFSGAQKGKLVLDLTQSHKGVVSLKHQAEGEDSYTQYYDGPQAAGLTEILSGEESYRLTVRARADVNTPIQLRIFGLAGDYTVLENNRTDATATANWKEFSVDFTPSDASEFISIRLDNDGGKGAVVWWDDLVLERLNAPTQ